MLILGINQASNEVGVCNDSVKDSKPKGKPIVSAYVMRWVMTTELVGYVNSTHVLIVIVNQSRDRQEFLVLVVSE